MFEACAAATQQVQEGEHLSEHHNVDVLPGNQTVLCTNDNKKYTGALVAGGARTGCLGHTLRRHSYAAINDRRQEMSTAASCGHAWLLVGQGVAGASGTKAFLQQGRTLCVHASSSSSAVPLHTTAAT
jgi:hypothetical protein